MTREELFQWVKQEYGTEAEYPWKDSNAVLRRADNDKWYGVILSVAGSKLGLEDDNIIYVINLKSDPMLIGSLREYYFTAIFTHGMYTPYPASAPEYHGSPSGPHRRSSSVRHAVRNSNPSAVRLPLPGGAPPDV